MKNIPYTCHVFVCVNDRQGSRKSCADGGSTEIRRRIKEAVTARGWSKKDVRISQSLCLGLCGCGPNVMIYPQGVLFSEVQLDDVEMIVEQVAGYLEAS